ncbi:MAG: proline--tRNA ligase [Candidatus Kapabacteria bacterium]|nr:proline--tRNA ligase [Candidatus Kapabacteria bacterium]MCS7169950.1 proline--tRNA ligase [Candidatus Kapabacteria bacterium]MDW7997498.1 proline--tRNA ligase [Bacteroidota bacterium]MDW8225822.1 proline--tRNA ligase [Bacteroidota bacterium]
MRYNKAFIPTLREVPSEAQAISHQLMLRAGLVRQLSAGVYSFLPLGWRAMQKVMHIVRQEMDAIGGQEFYFPALNPIEIWHQTGRVESMGEVLFHIKNREGLVLAPTHEEVVAFHARQHVKSYKDLPQIWYQIQIKFRNEPRPRFGVLRGRQFTMKDSYSLDDSWEGLDSSYEKHNYAYQRIFSRCGLHFFVVGASSGAMGGSASQEFMVESPAGEDTCAVCASCNYAANIEVARSATEPTARLPESQYLERFPTPGVHTINDLVYGHGIPEERCAKALLYIVDRGPVLILLRGNDELNEAKLQAALGTISVRPAAPEELRAYTGATAGSIGPIGLPVSLPVIADERLRDANELVSGANADGYHYRHIDLMRDCRIDMYADLRTVQEHEPCPQCRSPLRIVRAIEVGHIFKLGTKYSEALGATFLDEHGQERPIVMGSYGIGIERIVAAFIEQNHDERGICWIPSIAPLQVHLIALGLEQSKAVHDAAEQLYQELWTNGVETLYDDRSETAGVKFNDADLIGLPLQLIVSPRNVESGVVEIKERRSGKRHHVASAEVVPVVQRLLKYLSQEPQSVIFP